VITSFVLDVMGLALSAYVMLGYFVEQREGAHRALEAERERSERLLLNVLPGYRVRDRSVTQSPIAEGLKVGTGVIADHCDTVSVLFADLVGFSERPLVMAADELVALVDEIFSAFDRLAMRRASRRSRRSATPIWWRAGCHNHVGTTSRRSLAWRSRCGTRSRRSEMLRQAVIELAGPVTPCRSRGRDKLEMQVPHLLTRTG
jgi:class 3 adenylate cyclase